MYTFAILALLALGAVKVVDLVIEWVPGVSEARSLFTVVVAVATVVVLDVSMFAGWETPVRDETLGVWVTGVAVAGLTTAWRAVFGYLTHDRATTDETLGEHRAPLRSAA